MVAKHSFRVTSGKDRDSRERSLSEVEKTNGVSTQVWGELTRTELYALRDEIDEYLFRTRTSPESWEVQDQLRTESSVDRMTGSEK